MHIGDSDKNLRISASGQNQSLDGVVHSLSTKTGFEAIEAVGIAVGILAAIYFGNNAVQSFYNGDYKVAAVYTMVSAFILSLTAVAEKSRYYI